MPFHISVITVMIQDFANDQVNDFNLLILCVNVAVWQKLILPHALSVQLCTVTNVLPLLCNIIVDHLR